jgi:hypothetical protein
MAEHARISIGLGMAHHEQDWRRHLLAAMGLTVGLRSPRRIRGLQQLKEDKYPSAVTMDSARTAISQARHRRMMEAPTSTSASATIAPTTQTATPPTQASSSTTPSSAASPKPRSPSPSPDVLALPPPKATSTLSSPSTVNKCTPSPTQATKTKS